MNPWIDVAGWTLVHFVWQGSVVAAVACVLLLVLRRRTPQTRYAVACIALTAMVAAPLLTVAVLSRGLAAAERDARAATPVVAALEREDAVPDALSILTNLTMAHGLASVALADEGPGAWIPLVVVLWIVGVGVLLLRLAGGWWRIHRLHRLSRHSPASPWRDAAQRVAMSLGIDRRVHVVDSRLVDTPTVIGWMTPIILLPVAALAGLSPAQVDAILAHELAHIRRHDFLVNLLQTLAETLLFYHPAVWWLSARIRAEREHCCDAVALSVCGDAVSYAEALVELESRRSLASDLAMAATGGPLLVRVRRVLGAPGDERPRRFGTMLVTAVVVLLMCVAAASGYLVAAQPDGPSAPQKGSATDPAAWSMTFNHADSSMRFIGYRGRDLVRFAYQVPHARVVGGPSWLDEQILNIVVTLGAVPRADEMPGIVRAALESRLQLKTHVEKRNFPVLALVKARADGTLGTAIRPASRPCFDIQEWIAGGQPRDRLQEWQGKPPCGGVRDSSLGWTRHSSVTMSHFAEYLRGYVTRWPREPKEPRPPTLGPSLVALTAPEIVDRTGLSGRYDIDFTAFYPTAALMSRFPFLTNVLEPLGFTSIPRALEDQLGLRLVESEAPYDVIVIEQAERP